jgi:hypothetical protein
VLSALCILLQWLERVSVGRAAEQVASLQLNARDGTTIGITAELVYVSLGVGTAAAAGIAPRESSGLVELQALLQQFCCTYNSTCCACCHAWSLRLVAL